MNIQYTEEWDLPSVLPVMLRKVFIIIVIITIIIIIIIIISSSSSSSIFYSNLYKPQRCGLLRDCCVTKFPIKRTR